ncbi:major facilitator superfamily member protein [Babesia ovata]|uniref:Major facilitator superfamily member protein n=1 Tax=Babesia ovata TaxID=189622 RepID=A0A2H6KBK0_9APIC|nr:major facilitator superfamily member protein [Babesia ovata]GBE60339.1 major facilitator superfamily member protein [Babesia ovata]
MVGTDSTTTKNKVEYDALAQALYYLVSFIEGYDHQMLSMCMRAFELTLGFSQSQLSTLATVSAMSRVGCCLIWGLLADNYESRHVLGAGLLVMGMASIVLSSASRYRSVGCHSCTDNAVADSVLAFFARLWIRLRLPRTTEDRFRYNELNERQEKRGISG